MIFETTSEQVKRLDASQLVDLLRMLVHAEAIKTGIPLYNAHIPSQITVADGGEDGRIQCSWASNITQTDFFPSSFIVFQAKATNLSESKIRKEILKKGTGTKKKPAVLNDAISSLLKKNGSYILFTSQALVGERIDHYKKTIKKIIRELGENPARLCAIEIFDANRISAWVNTHQAVSLWLNQRLREKDYSSFMSYEQWGQLSSMLSPLWVEDDEPRFTIHGGYTFPASSEDDVYSFRKTRELIIAHLSEQQSVIRISGSSGIGKSRFARQLFNSDEIGNKLCVSLIIYCNYCDVKEKVIQLANYLSISHIDSILVVDECSDAAHRRLIEISGQSSSKLRVITLDVETGVQSDRRSLRIEVHKLSEKCIRNLYPEQNLGQHKNLIDGSPGMAILVSTAIMEEKNPITKLNELIEHMVWGKTTPALPALRALEVLCLFGFLGCDREKFAEIQAISMQLVETSPETMYRHLVNFMSRGIVERLGDYFKAKPLPLSLCLAEQALNAMAPTTRSFLCNELSPDLLIRLLNQIKWLHYSKPAQDIAAMLFSDSFWGNYQKISEGFGATALMHMVEVTPDLVLSTLERVFLPITHEKLLELTHNRREVVWTLEKLCFPRESFLAACRLLLNLAAAENEPRLGNNATEIFKRLFHLKLAGTEAEPALRFIVLDESLNSQHTDTRRVGLEALGAMLETSYFRRIGGIEQLGLRSPRKDWAPQTYEDIYFYYRKAIKRLTEIASNPDDPFGERAKELIAGNIRALLGYEALLGDLSDSIFTILKTTPSWPEALYAINSWLYFDAIKTPKKFSKKVHELSKCLTPVEPIELVVYYTKNYPTEIHNPETAYSDKNLHEDFEFANRESRKLAQKIAGDEALFKQAVIRLLSPDIKNPFAFLRELIMGIKNTEVMFLNILKIIGECTQPINQHALVAIMAGISAKDNDVAQRCLEKGLDSPVMEKHAVALLSAVTFENKHIETISKLLKSGSITPFECRILSYERRLEHLQEGQILKLARELEKYDVEGVAASITIINMYLHGRKIKGKQIADHIKALLVDSHLLYKCNDISSYDLSSLFIHVEDAGYCDAEYTKKILQRFMFEPDSFLLQIHDKFSSAKNGILQILIKKYPSVVWSEISNAFANPKNRAWLKHLFSRKDDHRIGPSESVLMQLPEALYIEWANEADSGERLSFILSWIPDTIEHDGIIQWHPLVLKIMAHPKITASALDAIKGRMEPTSWINSIIPHLQKQIPIVKELLTHESPVVSAWAISTMKWIQSRISMWRAHEEEDSL